MENRISRLEHKERRLITQNRQMAQNSQFEWHQVIGMHPIFGGLTDKCTLIPTSAGISLNRMSAGANKVIELGEFNNEGVPVILVEWPFLKILLDEGRLQRDAGLFLHCD